MGKHSRVFCSFHLHIRLLQTTSQCSFSEPNTVVWAVSSLTAVPPGALLINPTTGQAYTNPDGSLYRHDPDNPIKLCPTIEEDVSTTALSSPNSGAKLILS